MAYFNDVALEGPTTLRRLYRDAATLFAKAANVWVLELIDKNAAEVSFTCPFAWAALSASTFQCWDVSFPLEGASFHLSAPLRVFADGQYY